MDRNDVVSHPNGFLGFVFIRVHLSRSSLDGGGFVIKMDILLL
jgi:hypothetical protein